MNLRTTFNITPSARKIDYNTQIMFIGSCFASEVGSKMAEGKMNVLINPAGTVYNPASTGATIDFIISGKEFTNTDLHIYKGINFSFSHYTNYSSEDPEILLDRINGSVKQAHDFLRKADFLFITFGTARIFRFKETGEIVSNCHKLPASLFARELLTVDDIFKDWTGVLNRLKEFNRKLQVIFTISPVRHWKDGAHGNQISKSVLFLAVEKLLDHPAVHGYFPAYELLMDDLRDYRYYDNDMLHPSGLAVDYIWQAFSDCYFDSEALKIREDILSVVKGMNHRFLTDSLSGRKEFAGTMLKRISLLEKQNISVNFSSEKAYFQGLIEK